MVHHQLRWSPGYYRLRELVRKGAIGELRQAEFDMFVYSDVCVSGYRSRLPQLILHDLAVHHFDLMRYVTDADCESVYARSWRPNEEDVSVPATAAAHAELEFAGPVTVSYRCKIREILEPTGYHGRISLTGSRGMADLRDGRLRLRTYKDFRAGKPAKEIDPKPPRTDTWQAFAHAIKTRTPTLTSSADNLGTLKIVFAAVKSVKTGRIVRLS